MEILEIEKGLDARFEKLEGVAYACTKRILKAFQSHKISVRHFSGTTGYGYDDSGRDTLRKVYADVFGGQDAIVSPNLTCGSHAISTVLFGLLRPKDDLLSIAGKPYDTLDDTIWGKGNGSLKEFGISYEQVDLKDDHLNEEQILKRVKKLKPKVVFLQRSRGYSWRSPICVDDMKSIFSEIKKISPNSFIVVDNCYGEFVEEKEPTMVGADVIVGSLIKNPGGGLVSTGGYVVGSAQAIKLISYRLTSPSLGMEVGSYEMGYRLIYQGLFMAPSVVKNALMGSYLLGEVMKQKGYKILPDTSDDAYDIIKSIEFKTEEELIKFVQKVQTVSPVDSHVLPLPWAMPGYQNEVIMAAGTFVDGASIELSCDSPIKKPYIAYFQGGITFEHCKIFAEELLNNY